jgi:menaquinone-dependent protoporphyrinogen oxidase
MAVLVTAASRYGSTAEIASAIGDVLRDSGLDVAVVPPDTVKDLDAYEAVVMGSAVYAGRWVKPAREFVDRLTAELVARPVWLFSSGPVGEPPKPEEDPVDVAAIVEATGAIEHRVFAGKIVRKQLRFADRAIAVALKVPDGDFRDWAAIKAWAEGIATAVQRGS